jgi:hypothetical protein
MITWAGAFPGERREVAVYINFLLDIRRGRRRVYFYNLMLALFVVNKFSQMSSSAFPATGVGVASTGC